LTNDPPIRLLVAGDDATRLASVGSLLQGYRFVICGETLDGTEAVELAARLEPDAVVVAGGQPAFDGIEVATRILAVRSVPIVMVAAAASDMLIDRAVAAGLFGVLTAPVSGPDLVASLRAATARHAEFVESRRQAAALARTLAERKVIERAKGVLMAKEGLSETEALRRLRRASQKSGTPMTIIAEVVTATLE